MLWVDEGATIQQKREGMMLALAQTAEALDASLPAEQEDKYPAWARDVMKRLDVIEKRIEDVFTGGQPEDTHRPAMPARKSQTPDIRPSAIVEKAATFGDIVQQLIGGGETPRLP